MAHELQVERAARKDLSRVPDNDYKRIEAAIDGLVQQPRPRGAKKLRGIGNRFRIRVGAYRIVYAVFDVERTVRVLRIVRRTTTAYDSI